jgi:hypothetical protein
MVREVLREALVLAAMVHLEFVELWFGKGKYEKLRAN